MKNLFPEVIATFRSDEVQSALGKFAEYGIKIGKELLFATSGKNEEAPAAQQ